MLRSMAMGFGIVMIILSVLAWVPGLNQNGLLFGVFDMGPAHNAMYAIAGVIALLAGFTTERAARGMFQFVGIVVAIVAIAGFFVGDEPLLGILDVTFADHVLHAVIALFCLALGFAPTPERRFAQPGSTIAASETPRGI